MLQQMSKAAAPMPQALAPSNEPMFEPLHVLQMALELDENSPGLWRALDALVAADQVAGVIELLGQMPACDVARSLWARMRTPVFVQRLLDEAPYDQGLDSLVPHLPTPALVPLFDLLLESEDRHVRRTTFDRLRRAGQAATPLILERLTDPRWYVIRNLLSLVAFLDPLPPGFDPAQWLDDADARVRREALRVALRVNRLRSRAIGLALDDQDPTITALGLNAALESCPPDIMPRLIALAGQPGLKEELRALTVKALVRRGDVPEVLELLLRITGGETFFSRWGALPPTTPTLLAALAGLARHWPREHRAARVIQRARKSTETAVQAAATESQS
jgi:hypothetical protein